MSAPPSISNSEVGVVVNITGPDELKAKWADIGSRLRAGTRAMLFELGSAVADAASAAAPRGKTGKMSRSYMVARRMGLGYKEAATERVIIRAKTTKRFVYPVVVEFGNLNNTTMVNRYFREGKQVRRDVVFRKWRRGYSYKSLLGGTEVRSHSRKLTMKSQHTFGDTWAAMEPNVKQAIQDGLAVMAKRAAEGT